MNKQQLFADAHKSAKSLAPAMGYRKAFKYALAICWNNKSKYTVSASDKIQKLAKFLINFTGNAGKYRSFNQQADLADDLIHQATLCGGFAAEVAQTVQTTGRVSDKQSYIIAKAIVDNNRTGKFAF